MLKKITAAGKLLHAASSTKAQLLSVNAKQSVVARLRQHTAFKNPEIMGQLVQFVQIDEKGRLGDVFFLCLFHDAADGFSFQQLSKGSV